MLAQSRCEQINSFLLRIGELYPKQMTVVNKSFPDQPLVYANKNFLEFTGYSEKEVLGQNCRFLQKNSQVPEYKFSLRNGLRDYINHGVDCCVDLKNYKKDGTVFVNRLCLIHCGEELCLGLQNHVGRIALKKVKPAPQEVLQPFLQAMDDYFESGDDSNENLTKITMLLEDMCSQLTQLTAE